MVDQVSISLMYRDFGVMLANYQAEMDKKDVPTISDLRLLREMIDKHSVLSEIVKLKNEITKLMRRPGNGDLVNRKIMEMEQLVEKL